MGLDERRAAKAQHRLRLCGTIAWAMDQWPGLPRTRYADHYSLRCGSVPWVNVRSESATHVGNRQIMGDVW